MKLTGQVLLLLLSSAATVYCNIGLFRCTSSNELLPYEWVCNGQPDCADESDESQCGCEPFEWRCSNGECIANWLWCDNNRDCSDGSDERECPSYFPQFNCTVYEFKCDRGPCIRAQFRCDGEVDCWDATDEANCTSECNQNHFNCSNGECIPINWQCDTDEDCQDGSDEEDCAGVSFSCGTGFFNCTNGDCINTNLVCDGSVDCRTDTSDEDNCPYGGVSCYDHEFRCTDTENLCIPMTWVCDGSNDCCEEGEECRDFSDETGCEGVCNRYQFECTTGGCANITSKCDGVLDCRDGSDEFVCPYPPPRLQCADTQYTCLDGQQCIDVDQVCDDTIHCNDGSDEDSNICSAGLNRSCSIDNGGCDHFCFEQNGSVICTCRHGYQLGSDARSCHDINECDYPYTCSQYCENTEGSYDCTCAEGYEPHPTKGCHGIGPPPVLILANHEDIRAYYIESDDRSLILVRDLHYCMALDYHYEYEYLFWTDVSQDVIKRSTLLGQNITTIISNQLSNPGGLAVDWINDKLYWTDSGTRRIEVSNIDGTNRTVLFSTELSEPRAIVLDPEVRYMFWTDWGEHPKIERASMDGQNRTTLHDVHVVWPNALTVDYVTKSIYWGDAKFRIIESCFYDGSHRRPILTEGVRHIFAMSLFEDTLYWSEWETRSILSTQKGIGYDVNRVENGTTPAANVEEIDTDLFRPHDVHVFHHLRQKHSPNPCADDNGGCEYQCLLSASSPDGYSCLCPPGIKVDEDGRSCKPLNTFLLFAHYTDIRRVSLDTDIPVDVIIPLANLTGALDLDWDDRTDQLFWTDLQQNTINAASLSVSAGGQYLVSPEDTNQRVLLTNNIKTPAGLAVDWLNNKLYWTDDADPERIEVAEFDGSNRAILVHDRMDKPRDIIVYPTAGLMFWTDWGKYPKIERANLDGTDRVDIVSNNLDKPNGLAIDFEINRLYWCDGDGYIEYSNLDGSNRVQLLFDSSLHPFGLTLLDDWVYFTDLESDSVYRVDKLSGENKEVLITDLNRPFDIHVYHRNRTRPADHPCWTENGGCSHLCLTRPSEAGGLEASCVCPTGYTLTENGKTCNEYINHYLLFPTENQLRQISLDTDFLANIVLPVDRVRAVSSVAVDIQTDDYYWADTLVSKIYRAPGNGGDAEVFIGTSILRPESMALDWIGRNLFWADSELGRIEVAQLERGSRHVLFSTDLQHVNALDIDLKSHRMFWIDAGDLARSISAKIERATMDGQHRKAIISTNLGQPRGIAIDNYSGVGARIYWTDPFKGTIESATYEGTERITVIVYPQDGPAFPLGIAVAGEYLFWTDVSHNSVYRANKRDGTEQLTVLSDLPTVSDIAVINKADLNKKANFAHGCDAEGQSCSDICLPNVATSIYTCVCPTGIRLMDDDMTCRTFPEEYVLVPTRTNIRRVSLDTEEDFNDVTIIDGLYDVLVLDYLLTSAEDGIIVYGDSILGGIYTANLNGTDPRIIISDVNQTEGLAVDWINHNVYWTEVATQTLSVANLDGQARKTLIRNIDKPRAIALHPEAGLMFWTDWGAQPKIELATMDGKQRQIVVEENIHWPNGLAVDRENYSIYWVDGFLGRERLETCDFNGGKRRTIVQRNKNSLAFPFGLAFFRGFVFWTDWELKGLFRKRVGDSAGSEVLIQRFVGAKPFQPIVVSTQYPREGELTTTGPCSVDNGDCPYLCLPQGDNRHTCACPDDLLETNLCEEDEGPSPTPRTTTQQRTTVTTEEETTTTQSPTTPTIPDTPPIDLTDPNGQNGGGTATTTAVPVTAHQLSSTEWFMLVFGVLTLILLIAMLVVGCLIAKWIRDRAKSTKPPGTVRMEATNPHYCTSKFEGPVPLSKLGGTNPISTTKPDKVIGNLLPKHYNNAPRRCSSPTAANIFVEKTDVFVIPEPQRRKRPKTPRTCSVSVVPLLENSSPSPPMPIKNQERIPACSSAPIPKQENTAKQSKKTVRFDANVPLGEEAPPIPQRGVPVDAGGAKLINKEVPRPISVSESDSTVSTEGSSESKRPLIKTSTTPVRPPTAPHAGGNVDTSESSC